MKKALFLMVALLAIMATGCTNSVEKQVEQANEEAALNDNKAADPAVTVEAEDNTPSEYTFTGNVDADVEYVVKAQIEVSTKMVDKTATPADDARMTHLINDARKYYGPGGPGADKSEEFSNKLSAKLAAEVNNLAAEVKGQKK